MLSKSSTFNSNSCNNISVEYDLKNKIGEGTFSDVWLCVQRNTGQELAAKILKKNYGKTMSEDKWKTISEVCVTSSLEIHPFLLTMKGAYHETDTGRIILVTELMKKSLYDLIENGECPLPDARVKTYMYQMLEGLKYLHENGFIHRDIKPENILLKSKDKVLKIGDFGTACHVTEGQPYMEYVATRWYRSPECLLTRGWYSTKMDIWASGCVLYEMSTGSPLFNGQDGNDQMEKIDQVLGSPDYRLICKFKKHKSDMFEKRYESSKQKRLVVGTGLHSVYQPYRPAFDVMKDMIVYDPIKRFSADRLLRKAYFYAIKNTTYEYKMREFENVLRTKGMDDKFSDKEIVKSVISKVSSTKIQLPLVSKKQGPGGDREQNLQKNTVQYKKVDKNISIIQEPINICPDNKKKNPQKSCAQGNLNCLQIIQDLDVYSGIRKQTPRLSCLKSNTKNNIQAKKSMVTSVSTISRGSIIKNVRNSLNNRPPFK